MRQFDEEDRQNITFALQRLMGNTKLRNYDTSGMEYGHSINDDIDDNARNLCSQETKTNKEHDEFSRHNINDVHKLPMSLLFLINEQRK